MVFRFCIPPIHQKKENPNTSSSSSSSENMFAVAPRNRNRKLQLLSFAEAMANLPKSKSNSKPRTSTNRRTTRKRPASPLPNALACRRPATATKTASASAFFIPKTKISKPCPQKQTPPTPHQTIALDTLSKLPKTQSQKNTTAQVSEERDPCLGKALGIPVLEVSPDQALRAAVVKSRFAAVIYKAQHHLLFDSTESAAAAAAAATANIVEATAAYQLKKARERESERGAARNSILKVEQAADGRDNLQLFKELEELCGCPLSYDPPPQYAPYLQRRFGLVLKE